MIIIKAVADQFQRRVAFFLDLFAPPERSASSSQLTRDRVLIGYVLLQTLALPIGGLYLLASPSLGWTIRLQSMGVMVALAATYAGWLWMFRRGMPRRIALHGAVGIAFLTVYIAIITTGGIDATAISLLLLLVPALGFCIGGERTGICWTLVVIVGLALLRGDLFDRFVLLPLSETATRRIDNVIWGISLVSLGGILMVYEQMYRWYSSRLYREREMYYQQAHRDNLTGLANQRAFEATLRLWLGDARNAGRLLAVVYIDLDDFKPINDEYGHDAGDQVLREISQRIGSCLRDADLGARLGGDEFGILVGDLRHEDEAHHIARRLELAFARPVIYQGRSIPVGASMGQAIYPLDGQTAEDLQRLADERMYQNKRRSKIGLAVSS